MTDAAGLVLGVPGFITGSLDLHDRWGSAKSFQSEFDQAKRAWDYCNRRRQAWIDYAGFDGETLKDTHHPRLDDLHVRAGARDCFKTISEVYALLGEKTSKLKIDSPGSEELLGQIASLSIATKRKPGASSMKGMAKWSWHGKQFKEGVERLYALVPEAVGSVAVSSTIQGGMLPSLLCNAMVGVANAWQHAASSGSITLSPELEQSIREITRVSQMARLDEWLIIPRIDQQYDRYLRSRLDGTCDWIFDHSQYKAWQSEDANDSKARILWICGPPGFGKSVLCARIVEKLQQENRALAYYFCSAFVQTGMKPEVIARWWIRQLVHQDEDAFGTVWEHCVHRGQPVASSSDVFEILRAVLAAKSGYTLVVDGLDEFGQPRDTELDLENHRGEMLRRLRDAISGSNSRVLIVSRQDIRPDISSVMRGFDDPLLLTCQITSRDVRADIEKFAAHVVEAKLPTKQDPLRIELSDSLMAKSDGMFLWIKMQERQLQDYKSQKQLRTAVSMMPKGLHHTFERSWKSIRALPDIEDQQRAVAILRWSAFTFYPLTVSQMAEALLVEQDPEMEGFEIPTVGETYE